MFSFMFCKPDPSWWRVIILVSKREQILFAECCPSHGQSHGIALYQGCITCHRLVTKENCWKENRSWKIVRFAIVGLEKVMITSFHLVRVFVVILYLQNKANQGTIKNMPSTLLYKNTRPWFLWFYLKVWVQISVQPKFQRNRKKYNHVFLSRVINCYHFSQKFFHFRKILK